MDWLPAEGTASTMSPCSEQVADSPFMLESDIAGTDRKRQEEQTIHCHPTTISVVVPLFNAERYVEWCIQALLAQDYPTSACEIIVVDNNSTDRSATIVRQHRRIRLLSEREQGAYAARNRALRHAVGTIIAFIDPDCVPDRNWLKTIAAGMADPVVGILVGGHQFAPRSFALSALEAYENAKKAFALNGARSELHYGHANNMAVRRSLLDELGPFAERHRGSDTLLVQRCLERYSVDAVRFCDAMKVRHLEIDSVGAYFHKCAIYGASQRWYRQIANVRPLDMGDRWTVYRRTVRQERYSPMQAVYLLGLLAVGFLYWVWGGRAAPLAGDDKVIRLTGSGRKRVSHAEGSENLAD
jgi:glycosyltransferase involved in cell wall biosynthesis